MKPYVKPDLGYENFTLSESIAACSADEGWVLRGVSDLNSCYAEINGWDGIKPYATEGVCNQIEVESACYTLLSGSAGLLFGSY